MASTSGIGSRRDRSLSSAKARICGASEAAAAMNEDEAVSAIESSLRHSGGIFRSADAVLCPGVRNVRVARKCRQARPQAITGDGASQSPVGAIRNSMIPGTVHRCCDSRAAASRSRVRITIRYSNTFPISVSRCDRFAIVNP